LLSIPLPQPLRQEASAVQEQQQPLQYSPPSQAQSAVQQPAGLQQWIERQHATGSKEAAIAAAPDATVMLAMAAEKEEAAAAEEMEAAELAAPAPDEEAAAEVSNRVSPTAPTTEARGVLDGVEGL